MKKTFINTNGIVNLTTLGMKGGSINLLSLQKYKGGNVRLLTQGMKVMAVTVGGSKDLIVSNSTLSNSTVSNSTVSGDKVVDSGFSFSPNKDIVYYLHIQYNPY